MEDKEQSKGRITYIDIAKFFGIFLLLIEHTANWTELSGRYLYIKKWICSFHMPLFFIVLGLVISQKRIDNVKGWVRLLDKRVKALIIPYIIWCFIYAPSFDDDFFAGILYGTNPTLGQARTNQVLWFLPVMFISMILYQMIIDINYVLCKQNNITWNIYCLLEAIILTALSMMMKEVRGSTGWVWGIDIAYMGCAFILYGALLKELLNKLTTNKWSAFVSLCVFLLIGIIIALNNAPDEYWITIMALAMYGHNIFLYIIGALCNTSAIVLLSSFLSKIRILSWLGENSLFIMACHYIIFPYTVKWSVTLLVGHNIMIAFMNAMMTILICIPILYVVKKYAPILIGK